MSYSVTPIDLSELASLRRDANGLVWPFPFVLPAWLKVWWASFGEGREPCLRVIRDGDEVIGAATMMAEGTTVAFMGDTDVCDYEDFVLKPGRERDALNAWLDVMVEEGMTELDLGHVRPDSAVVKVLLPLAKERGLAATVNEEAITFEMALPGEFEAYLESLDKKQRHEVRRKMRRLGGAGEVAYDLISDAAAVPGLLDNFFQMFTESRDDKKDFMTGKMETFFRALVASLADAGVLKIGVLQLDGKDIASIICFDQDGTRYLYNCGYDPDYTALSAGQMSKVLAIRDAVKNGYQTFDFLKGQETYKHHLGGQEMTLARCRIELTRK
jgi:CelD/BcsL family acetyltransferase involved in cellulose biosynthesis